MKTNLSTENIKDLISEIYNGEKYDEDIVLIDEDGEQQTTRMSKYLNIQFYAYKDRLVVRERDNTIEYSAFQDWVENLKSINDSYALVEITDEEALTSIDIDSTTKSGKITFLVQSDKVNLLENYSNKLRNALLGVPEKFQNSYGELMTSYLVLGIPLYEQEPINTPFGECMVITVNFKISYLNDAITYSDQKVELSLLTENNFFEVPITKMTWQNVFMVSAVPTINRPELTGAIATSMTSAFSFSFFDFNKGFMKELNKIFYRLGAYKINGEDPTTKFLNIPVFMRVTYDTDVFTYKLMLEQVEKVITNGDFNIVSMILKTWGKELMEG